MIEVRHSPALRSKYFSISRANQVFHDQIEEWLALADEKHGHVLGRNFSQMKTLKHCIDKMVDKNEHLKQLSLDSTKDDFLESAPEAVRLARATEFVWDYFRDKLQQRLLREFEHCLSAADLIAHDCYKSVMNHVKLDLNIRLEEERDTPLSYLEAGLDASGRARGAATYRAGNAVKPPEFKGVEYAFAGYPGYERNKILPIAVIELPTSLAHNVWELVVLGHEVTHDIDGDLNTLHTDLPNAVERALQSRDPESRGRWKKWTLEVFADLMALRLMGPAYVRRCFQHLAVKDVCPNKHLRYPSNYLRMLLMLTYLKQYLCPKGDNELQQYLKAQAETLQEGWESLYGHLPQDQVAYKDDFKAVIDAMMNTPLPALTEKDGKEHRACELVTFTNEHRKAIRKTKKGLLDIVERLPHGEDAGKLREQAKTMVDEFAFSDPQKPPEVRHVASAAYMAFEKVLKEGGREDLVRQRMESLNVAAQELVKAKQPKVMMAAQDWTKEDETRMSARVEGLFEMLLPSLE